MEFTFRIKVGSTEIEIKESAGSQREMFEKISFFSSLPTKAPKGAEDLKIVYRKTKGNDEFYSIVSDIEKMEYKFGIHKNAEKTLFPKGWEPLYEGSSNNEQEDRSEPAAKTSGTPAFASRANVEASEPEAAPAPTVSKPKVNIPGAPKASAPAASKPAGTNPAVNNILNKYLPNKTKA